MNPCSTDFHSAQDRLCTAYQQSFNIFLINYISMLEFLITVLFTEQFKKNDKIQLYSNPLIPAVLLF